MGNTVLGVLRNQARRQVQTQHTGRGTETVIGVPRHGGPTAGYVQRATKVSASRLVMGVLRRQPGRWMNVAHIANSCAASQNAVQMAALRLYQAGVLERRLRHPDRRPSPYNPNVYRIAGHE
jgi:hypothetical protein